MIPLLTEAGTSGGLIKYPFYKSVERMKKSNVILLLGMTDTSREAPIFFSRPPDRKDFYGFENLPYLAVREGQWKLLCDYDGERPQLYNLEADPGESRNMAEDKPVITRELTQKTVDWWQSVRMSVDNKIFIP